MSQSQTDKHAHTTSHTRTPPPRPGGKETIRLLDRSESRSMAVSSTPLVAAPLAERPLWARERPPWARGRHAPQFNGKAMLPCKTW